MNRIAAAAMLACTSFADAGTAFADAGAIGAAELRSGFESMGAQTRAMQRDDSQNPGMLWVLDGEAIWTRREGAAGRSCEDCHADARTSMRGASARYPSFDERSGLAVDLTRRVNLCRERHQKAPAFAAEGQPLLALTAYVAHQSRGLPTAPDRDPRLDAARERGRTLFRARIGQLDFSCAQCHDERWGKRLAGSVIPQGHPNGYPLYRLEWQSLGSLQRRLRNCMTGVRAEPYPYGAQQFVDLELYLQWRGRGLPIEAPAVRP